MDASFCRSSRTWSIYSRSEITERYEILDRIGSGAYSDVYRGRRLSDGLVVALKEIHDYQSSFREIESLQILRDAPNVVDLIEYFWQEDDDAVLILEYLHADLAAVIRDGKKAGGLCAAEVKQWMLQILSGVDACHRNSVLHRDLKPSNLLISAGGMLKLADFGQAIIIHGMRNMNEDSFALQQEAMACVGERATFSLEDDADLFKSSYSYDVAEGRAEDKSGDLTSCVGTRWFRAPELLYGSTNYGEYVDLWSVGCIFAELLTMEPLFPGTSDIDQICRIIAVLGDFNEAAYPGCSKLPDYGKIAFNKVVCPISLDVCLRDCHSFGIGLVKKLACYDPNSRSSAADLLGHALFKAEPLPLPLNELKVPTLRDGQDAQSSGEGADYRNMEYYSDAFDNFAGVNVINMDDGFSIRFS